MKKIEIQITEELYALLACGKEEKDVPSVIRNILLDEMYTRSKRFVEMMKAIVNQP